MLLTKRIKPIFVNAFALILILILLTPFASAFASAGQTLTTQNWAATMRRMQTPGIGCYDASFPSLVWSEVQCGEANQIPLTVGNGHDEFPSSPSGTLIGYSDGLFYSITGYTSEKDNFGNANYYSLQVNSQEFSITYGNHPANAWEQFAFENPGAGSGIVFIQYWLVGYYAAWGSCPSAPYPLTGFMSYGSSCYANSPTTGVSQTEPASNLIHLSISGSAAFGGSTNDEVTLCDSAAGQCYSKSVQDTVFNLYKYWQDSEFNVLGYGGTKTGAFFNSATSMTIYDNLETGSSSIITPSCNIGGFSAETNNRTLGSCSVNSSGTLTFTES